MKFARSLTIVVVVALILATSAVAPRKVGIMSETYCIAGFCLTGEGWIMVVLIIYAIIAGYWMLKAPPMER